MQYALRGPVRSTDKVQANAYLDTYVLSQTDFAKILKDAQKPDLIDTFEWDADGMRPGPGAPYERPFDKSGPNKSAEVEKSIAWLKDNMDNLPLTDDQKRLRELQQKDMEQETLICQLLNTMDKQDKFGKSSIADGI